jgi:hypothetical protein
MKRIQAMLKLIPNNFSVTLEDLEEIFKDEIQSSRTVEDP